MADPYRNSNDPNRIETKQDRRARSMAAIKDGVVAGAKFVGSAVMQAMERLIPQGASALAGALIPSSAVVQNLDPQQGPTIGPPEQGQAQSGDIEPPRHRTEAEVASQSETLNGYLTGYKPPVRVDHNAMYGVNQSRPQSL